MNRKPSLKQDIIDAIGCLSAFIFLCLVIYVLSVILHA